MIEHAIYDLLSNNAGVSVQISDRVYPMFLPEKTVYPACVYDVEFDKEDETFDGQGSLQNINAQFHCFAKTHAESLTVSDAIKTALKNYSGTNAGVEIHKVTIESELTVYEDDPELFRRTILATIVKR